MSKYLYGTSPSFLSLTQRAAHLLLGFWGAGGIPPEGDFRQNPNFAELNEVKSRKVFPSSSFANLDLSWYQNYTKHLTCIITFNPHHRHSDINIHKKIKYQFKHVMSPFHRCGKRGLENVNPLRSSHLLNDRALHVAVLPGTQL